MLICLNPFMLFHFISLLTIGQSPFYIFFANTFVFIAKRDEIPVFDVFFFKVIRK